MGFVLRTRTRDACQVGVLLRLPSCMCLPDVSEEYGFFDIHVQEGSVGHDVSAHMLLTHRVKQVRSVSGNASFKLIYFTDSRL